MTIGRCPGMEGIIIMCSSYIAHFHVLDMLNALHILNPWLLAWYTHMPSWLPGEHYSRISLLGDPHYSSMSPFTVNQVPLLCMGEARQMRVKCFAQKHNFMARPGWTSDDGSDALPLCHVPIYVHIFMFRMSTDHVLTTKVVLQWQVPDIAGFTVLLNKNKY